jgi:hypothetical protein
MLSLTCFSPDGDQALFDARVDGSGLRQLTPFSFEVGTKADWSPDSSRIMFISQMDGAVNTATIKPDGTGLSWVTNYVSGGPLAFGNSYSPDGRWILLRLEIGDQYALYKVHPDGSDLQAITPLSSFRPRGMAWGSAEPNGSGAPFATLARADAGTASEQKQLAEPLVGTWDTGPFPTSKLRAGLRTAGYSAAEIDGFFKNLGLGKVEELNLVFYRDHGRRFQVQRGWDPSTGTEPSDGDHGPYTLLRNHRFVVSGVDPPTNKIHSTYAYTIRGDRLKLRFVSLREPFPARQQRLDKIFNLFTAMFPYKRIS